MLVPYSDDYSYAELEPDMEPILRWITTTIQETFKTTKFNARLVRPL